jgi:hypothetical protein
MPTRAETVAPDTNEHPAAEYSRGLRVELNDAGAGNVIEQRSMVAYTARMVTMRICILIAALLVSGVTLRAEEPPAPTRPFEVGEKLTYQIYWGPFVVGRATLEVAGIEQVDGHDCYHLIAEARTSGLANSMYPVKTRTESWMDVEGLFTRKFKQDRSEGSHRRQDQTQYHYQQGKAVTTNFLTGKQRPHAINGHVQDVISSVYYMRAQPLSLKTEYTFTVNASQDNFKVTVRPDQRKQMNLRPVGTVNALRMEPDPTLKIVASNNGRMWFWVSDDERRLPLLVTSTMKIGSAKLVLFSIEQRKPDATAKSGRTPRVAPAAAEAPASPPDQTTRR